MSTAESVQHAVGGDGVGNEFPDCTECLGIATAHFCLEGVAGFEKSI